MRAHILKKNRLSSDINVTPMADIMLVLLIIFMITTPLLKEDVFVNLPRAKNPLDARITGPTVLSLTREGHLYLGKTRVTEREMAQVLSEHFAVEIDKSIFLRADQALSYAKVVNIVNECHKLGIERIGLMTDKEAQTSN